MHIQPGKVEGTHRIKAIMLQLKQSSAQTARRRKTPKKFNTRNTPAHQKKRTFADGFAAHRSAGAADSNSCRMNRSLLDLLVAARNGNRKTIAKCVRQHKRGILGAVGRCEEFDPIVVYRAKMEEKDFVDKMGVNDFVPRSAVAQKGC